MDTNTVRDQARKDFNAIKDNARENVKTVKGFAENVMDDMADANDAVYEKAAEVKNSIVYEAQAAKADVKAFTENKRKDVTAANHAMTQKIRGVQDAAEHTVHTVQANAKAGILKVGRINQDISTGVACIAGDVKHIGHKVVKTIRHHGREPLTRQSEQPRGRFVTGSRRTRQEVRKGGNAHATLLPRSYYCLRQK